MGVYNTGAIGSWISECDDIEELKEHILPLLDSQRAAWMAKFQEIMEQKKYSVRRMAQLCRVSEPAVRKWQRGSLPQSRDMYIRIGFAAGYDLDGMNAFLRRYGRCPQLYVKSLEDLVCIFVLRSETMEHSYAQYLSLLEMVRSAITGEDSRQEEAYSTMYLSSFASSLKNTEQMIQFAAKYALSFRDAYSRFYGFVNEYLEKNLSNELFLEGDGRRASFHAMAMESGWSSSLRQCISDIRNSRWFPQRNKVISLGLHLNMDGAAINQMLQYAQMEPLYPKNPIEAAVIWAIEEAKLCSVDDEIIPDGSSELCESVKDVLIQLDLAESEFLIDDL